MTEIVEEYEEFEEEEEEEEIVEEVSGRLPKCKTQLFFTFITILN